MMRFAHKTVLEQSDLKFCAVMQGHKSSLTGALLVYPHHAVFMQIQCSKDKISISNKMKYVLETPLLGFFTHGHFAFALTSTGRLLVTRTSDKFDSFAPVCDVKILEEGESLQFFAVSGSGNFLCVSGGDESCLVLNLSCPSAPQSSPVFLDGRKIIDLIGGTEDNFHFLTETSNGTREIVSLDADSLEISKIISVDTETEHLLVSNDGEREVLTVKPNSIAEIETPGRILAFCQTDKDLISCFCEGGLFCTYSSVSGNGVVVSGAPVVTSVYPLQNGLLVCYGHNLPIYIVKQPEPEKDQMCWDELLVCEIPRVTHLDQMVYSDGHVFLSSRGTIFQLTNEGDWESSDSICDIDPSARVVCGGSDYLVATIHDDNCSQCLKGAAGQICENQETLLLISKNKKIYQVTRTCVYANKKEDISFSSEAKMAACGDHGKVLCVVFQNNSVSTYRGNQSRSIEIGRDEVTACDICSEFLVLGLYSQNDMGSQLVLYDKNLDVIGSRIPMPAPVTSLRFGEHGNILYVGSQNGTVLRCLLDKETGFVGRMDYIFFGSGAIDMVVLQPSIIAFLCDGSLYFYYSNRLVKTGIDNVTSISERGSKLCYSKDAKVYQLDPESFDDDHEAIPLENEVLTRQVFNSEKHNVYLRGNTVSVVACDGTQRNAELSFENVVSMACRTNSFGDSSLVLVLNDHVLQAATYRDSTDQFELGPVYDVNEPVEFIHSYRDVFVFLARGKVRFCRILNNEIKILRTEIAPEAPITMLNVYKESIWTVDGDQNIITYRFDGDSGKLAVTCRQKFGSSVRLVKPFDDLSAVVCFNDGSLCVVQIPNHAFHGFVSFLGGQCPEFQMVLSLRLSENVIDVCVLETMLLYATEKGTVGALLPIMSRREFDQLSAWQSMVRDLYCRQVGICRRSRRAMAEGSDVLDLDLINLYLSMDNVESPPFCVTSVLGSIFQALNF